MRETLLSPGDFVLPLFLHDLDADEAIESMPGCTRWSLEGLVKEAGESLALGIPSVVLFPAIDESLKTKGAEADPNCIRCHTVGFGESSGYRREFAGQRLASVGCESCHGPGSEHVSQRSQALADSAFEVSFKFRKLGEADCTGCHYGEFSRPFVWKRFWPLVEHGKK